MYYRLLLPLAACATLAACNNNVNTNNTAEPPVSTSSASSMSSMVSQNAEVSTETSGSQSSVATTYTLAEVQAHASKDSCYTTIDNNVYDITSFITEHPGGERDIMKVCGRDGSSLFSNQHGNNAEAKAQLTSLYIGTLQQ